MASRSWLFRDMMSILHLASSISTAFFLQDTQREKLVRSRWHTGHIESLLHLQMKLIHLPAESLDDQN